MTGRQDGNPRAAGTPSTFAFYDVRHLLATYHWSSTAVSRWSAIRGRGGLRGSGERRVQLAHQGRRIPGFSDRGADLANAQSRRIVLDHSPGRVEVDGGALHSELLREGLFYESDARSAVHPIHCQLCDGNDLVEPGGWFRFARIAAGSHPTIVIRLTLFANGHYSPCD